MSRWLVLVNQASGRTPTQPETVRDALVGAGVDFTISVPASRAEAVALLVGAAHQGTTHFCIAGGDGTISMAVDTLLGLGLDTPSIIGMLPVGTGCDLMRTFALPRGMDMAARHLTTDDFYAADVVALEGSWGTKHYINVAQVGVGAAAAETAPKLSRKFGAMRYPIAFAARLPRFPRANVTLTTEKRTYEADALAVIMANAQYFAGGWNVAPRANLVDGLADLQVISASKTQAPALVPKIIKGTHLSDPSVRRVAAAEFTIETDIPWPLEADGDLVGNTPVRGRVVPAAVRLKI